MVAAHMGGDEALFVRASSQLADVVAGARGDDAARLLRKLLSTPRKSSAPRDITPAPESGGALIVRSSLATRFEDLVLDPAVKDGLDQVLEEQSAADRLAEHGLAPARKLLLVGPPGTGKTSTAAALAHALELPFYEVRVDSLVGKYLGDTGKNLRTVFDAIGRMDGVFLFDEFDGIGGVRAEAGGSGSGEMRRSLLLLLGMLEQVPGQALIVATTNDAAGLDKAARRRFHRSIYYPNPGVPERRALIAKRLSTIDTTAVDWDVVVERSAGLGHADIGEACSAELRRAVLSGDVPTTARLVAALDSRRPDGVGATLPQDAPTGGDAPLAPAASTAPQGAPAPRAATPADGGDPFAMANAEAPKPKRSTKRSPKTTEAP